MLDMVLGCPIGVQKNKALLSSWKAGIFEIGKKWGKDRKNNPGFNSPVVIQTFSI